MSKVILENKKDELPAGWLTCKFDNLAIKLKAGGTPSTKVKEYYENGTIPFVKIDDITGNGKYLQQTKVKITEEGLKNCSAWLVPKNSILYSMYASYGLPIINKIEVTTSQAIIAYVPPQNLVSLEFVYYYLSSVKNKLIPKGTTQKNLNAELIRNIDVLLPPLNEQKRIVAKIEELFSLADSITESINEVKLQLKQYQKKFLADLLQGKILSTTRTNNHIIKLITEERNNIYERELALNKSKKKIHIPSEPTILENEYVYKSPKHWKWVTLDSIINPFRGITYGVIKLGDDVEEGVPCLRTSDVKPLRIDTNNVKIISKKIADNYKRTYLQGGEVLVNVRGTLGGVSIVSKDLIGYNISREIAMIPVLPIIPSKWIMYWISSIGIQNWLMKTTRGITYRGINLEDLRNLPICLPPLEEIDLLINEIERHFSKISYLRQQFDNLGYVTNLKSKILEWAFKGKLVPQDPNDEPSEILLQKIKQEKEKLEQTQKGIKTKLVKSRRIKNAS